MGNEHLENALHDAGLSAEAFAEVMGVDPKSVQRWVAGTTTPYPRRRAAISRALGLPEHQLWPDTAANANEDPGPGLRDGPVEDRESDVVGAWAHAEDGTAPDVLSFITQATGSIDVLDSCCGIRITTDVSDVLRAHAEAGHTVRILTDGAAPHWEPLLHHHEVRLYLSEIPGEYWLIKTSDRMLLTINLDDEPGATPPPILELAPVTGGGLFERLASKFEELWQLTDDTGLASDVSAVSHVGDLHQAAEPVAPEGTGRRWPSRPPR